MQRAHHKLRRSYQHPVHYIREDDRSDRAPPGVIVSASSLKTKHHQMTTLMEAVRNFLTRFHIENGKPIDKQQFEAAQDRLQDRARKMSEATDALTEMIKRMKREENGNKRRRRGKCR